MKNLEARRGVYIDWAEFGGVGVLKVVGGISRCVTN
jgi:hypothetical protein